MSNVLELCRRRPIAAGWVNGSWYENVVDFYRRRKTSSLERPISRYTEAARANKIQGTVTLRVLVGADGGVQQVRVVRGLTDGLTEQAIAAAREAKFNRQ